VVRGVGIRAYVCAAVQGLARAGIIFIVMLVDTDQRYLLLSHLQCQLHNEERWSHD
jgi:hypothetical protein